MIWTSWLRALIVALFLQRAINAFSFPQQGCIFFRPPRLSDVESQESERSVDEGRRQSFYQVATHVSLPVLLAHISSANAAVMDPAANNVFKEGKSLSMAEAEARFKEGRKSAQYLLDHYSEISEGGGDNVRRYLGTVGTTSGLFGIGKVMNTLSARADDFVEYTELSNEILKSIQQADGSAYMAIFVTTSTSQTPPSKYFADANIEIKRCIKALDELADLIDVKF